MTCFMTQSWWSRTLFTRQSSSSITFLSHPKLNAIWRTINEKFTALKKVRFHRDNSLSVSFIPARKAKSIQSQPSVESRARHSAWVDLSDEQQTKNKGIFYAAIYWSASSISVLFHRLGFLAVFGCTATKVSVKINGEKAVALTMAESFFIVCLRKKIRVSKRLEIYDAFKCNLVKWQFNALA